MTTKVEIIRTDGTLEAHQVGKHIALNFARRMIGAKTLDTVNLRDGRIMLVDDNGYETEFVQHDESHFEMRPVKALKPVNRLATELYWSVCRPGVTHQIVGDVAIVIDEDMA